MRVITNFKHNYPEDPITHLDLAEFENDNKSVTLCYGSIVRGSKLIAIDLEEPIPREENIRKLFRYADIILNLCPWSSAWHNEALGAEICIPIFFPFNMKFAPKTDVKDIDVIYAGQIHDVPELEATVKSLTKFNYAHVNFKANDYTTHVNPTYEEKMNLYGRSKITIAHNVLWLNNYWAQMIKKLYPDWARNYAYKDIDQTDPVLKVYPQLKSRAFEAAFSKSLILCRYDQFRVLEHFFVPEKEFIYYYGLEDMREKIDYFSKYEEERLAIVNPAYERAINKYTTKHFYDKFIVPHYAK